MKKSIFLCIIFFSTYSPTLCLPGKALQPVSPATTAIAFDIDRVIIQPTSKQWYVLWDHAPTIFKALFDVSLITHVATLWWHEAPAEAYFDFLKRTQRTYLIPLIHDMVTARTPNPTVVAIIQKLKELGYSLHIATNETPMIFSINKKNHPNIFSLFDTVLCASYAPKKIRKPSQIYYKHLKKQISPTKQLFFIDDKQENIDGARKAGIIGIHFTTSEQLIKDLKSYNILPKTTAAHTIARGA